jgi:hypothetical protein
MTDWTELDEKYGEIPTGEVPPGKYIGTTKSCKLEESKNGTPLFIIEIEIEQGDSHIGASVDYIKVITLKTLAFLKKDIELFGLENVNPSDLQNPDVRNYFLDKTVEFSLKKDGQYTNVNFIRLMEDDFSEDAPVHDDDDAPWEG